MVLKCTLWSCISLGLMLAGNAVCQNQTPASTDDQKKADAAPARETIAKPLTEKEKKKRAEKLRKELETPYKKWLNEDVVYIITDEEKTAFKRLATDEEREQFIEQFWLRRDPTPDTEENEFKEEHYRRIAYANDHYASGIPGWKTDRGRIYIVYGPPDEIESHPSGGTYERPMEEGGGETSTYPFEQWRYRYLEGIGTNIIIEFVDPTMSGEYHMTMDPSEKDALTYVPGAGLTLMEQMGLSTKTQRFQNTDGTHLGQTFGGSSESMMEFSRLEQFAKLQKPPKVKFKDLEDAVTQQDHLQHPAHEGARRFLPADRGLRADLRHAAVRKQGSAVPGQGRRAEGVREYLWAHHHHDPAHRADLSRIRSRSTAPTRCCRPMPSALRFTRKPFRCRPARTASTWW